MWNQIECAFLASKLRLEQEAEGDEIEAKENGDADSSSSSSSSSSSNNNNRSHRGNVVELNGDVELAPNKSEMIKIKLRFYYSRNHSKCLSRLAVDGVVTKNSVLMSRQRQAAAQPETSYVCITPLRMLLKKRSDPRFGNNVF